LGTSAAYPGPDEACSGFLVQDENVDLLIDCGPGVLSNLQKFIDPRRVSNIIITHMHADHFFDLVHYRYALHYGLKKDGSARPALHLPPGGIEVLRQVVSPFAESPDFFADAFELSEYLPEKPLELTDVVVRFTNVRHYIATHGISVEGTRKLAYTSDSGLCPELLQLAQDADLFICNIGRCLGAEIRHLWGHLLPSEAGELARESCAKRLMITHLWPACDRPKSLQEASDAFGGPAELAEPCRTYQL
jgi:ribonuclease BN (tRNA processing enzyme)